MLTADFPVTQRLRAEIEAAAPDHFAQMAEMKWHLLTQWSLETLRYIDKELDLPGEECARYFNEAVDMVAATLKAGNLAELSGKAVQS